MSKSKEQLDNLIEKTQKVLDAAKRDRAALDETYSIGDRFRHHYTGTKLLLCSANNSDRNTVGLVMLKNGESWNDPIVVTDRYRMTKSELGRMCIFPENITRYYDHKKRKLIETNQ